MLRTSLFLLAMAVAGSASAAPLDAKLGALVGRPIAYAVHRLGPPTGESSPSGARTDFWLVNRDLTLSNDNDQPNKFGVLPPVGMSEGGDAPSVTYSDRCWVRLEVGADDRITSYAWSKNGTGCERFAARLP